MRKLTSLLLALMLLFTFGLAEEEEEELSLEDWKDYLETNEELSTIDRIVLTECMSRLSDQERQIVVLHVVSGFKHREIASMLELNLSTVLSKYHRAIRKLKTFIEKENGS